MTPETALACKSGAQFGGTIVSRFARALKIDFFSEGDEMRTPTDRDLEHCLASYGDDLVERFRSGELTREEAVEIYENVEANKRDWNTRTIIGATDVEARHFGSTSAPRTPRRPSGPSRFRR